MQFVVLLRQDIVEIRVKAHRDIPVSPGIPRPNPENSAEEDGVTGKKLIWPDSYKCSCKLVPTSVSLGITAAPKVSQAERVGTMPR